MRRLFGVVVLISLASAANHWRHRPAEVQGARQALGSVSGTLQATQAAA